MLSKKFEYVLFDFIVFTLYLKHHTGFEFFLFILNLCNLRMEKLIRMRSFFSFFGLEEFLFVSRTAAFEIPGKF